MDHYRHVQFVEPALPRARSSLPCAPAVPPRFADPGGEDRLSPEVSALVAAVLDSVDVSPHYYRAAPLARRLNACLRALRTQSAEEARLRIAAQPEAMSAALDSFLVGVTEFFRDSAVFASLDERLLASRRGLRVWSAGCSDGAELYSVAMLLARRGLLGECHLLGTDCRASALLRARQGRFAYEQVKDVPADLRADYLHAEDCGVRVRADLRAAVRWQQASLFDPRDEDPGWDLVLCRNVAIYLTVPAAALLWARLVSAMAADGVLVTGKAERPDRVLPLKRIGPCVFQKRKDASG